VLIYNIVLCPPVTLGKRLPQEKSDGPAPKPGHDANASANPLNSQHQCTVSGQHPPFVVFERLPPSALGFSLPVLVTVMALMN